MAHINDSTIYYSDKDPNEIRTGRRTNRKKSMSEKEAISRFKKFGLVTALTLAIGVAAITPGLAKQIEESNDLRAVKMWFRQNYVVENYEEINVSSTIEKINNSFEDPHLAAYYIHSTISDPEATDKIINKLNLGEDWESYRESLGYNSDNDYNKAMAEVALYLSNEHQYEEYKDEYNRYLNQIEGMVKRGNEQTDKEAYYENIINENTGGQKR
jgi:hypothetical protein